MIESQNIEFKESWRDEYQKWICGFINTILPKMYLILLRHSANGLLNV